MRVQYCEYSSTTLYQLEKSIWEKEIILDENTKPLKTLLHKHLAFFSDFVELTEGKMQVIGFAKMDSIPD